MPLRVARRARATIVALAVLLPVALLPVAGAAADLPRTLAWTAYETGTSGYAQAVGIGSALKNNLGVTLRILPGKNDLSRLVPVRDGKADFAANGIGTYMAQEGAFEFAHPDWGPQPLRMLAMSVGDYCMTAYVAGDLKVKTPYDMKGLRASVIRAAPGLNYNLFAYLRFGDLDWDDVRVVEFPGGSAAADSIVNGQADAAFGSTITGNVRKLEASPRGVRFPVLPHDDEAGWRRLLAAAPYYVKHRCSEGVGISKDSPHEGATYPYPILTAYAGKDADIVYAMTKAIFEQYEHYKGSAPGATGWGPDRQVLDWVVPLHEGAIRYYKEVGRWTDELQANNEANLKRTALLKKVWDDYAAAGKDKTEEAFGAGWQKARAAALEAAGLQVVWREW